MRRSQFAVTIYLVLGLAAIVAVAACGRPTASQTTPVSQTLTAVQRQKTATTTIPATLTVTATQTPTPAPTSTPRATTVPTPTPVATSTPRATTVPTPTPAPPLGPTSPATVRELPAPPLSLAVNPFDRLGVYALLTNNTLYRTVDDGETWRKVPLPAPERAPEGQADPARPNALDVWGQRDLVVTRVWPNRVFLRVDQTLYRRGEASWTPLLDRVHAWAVDGAEGREIYAWREGEPGQGSQGTHELHRSEDGGETWKHVYQGVFPPQLQGQDVPGDHGGIASLAIDPASPDILYAGTGLGLYRSLDGGRTWTQFEEGLPPAAAATRSTPLLVGGLGSGPLYALTETSPERSVHGAQAILVRLERGTYIPDEDRWAVVGQDVLQMLAQAEHGFWGVHALAVDPLQPGRLYLGSVQGLWRSADGGETWAPANLGGGPEARPVGAVYRIAVRSGEESELYLWSDTGLHVHLLTTPTISPEEISHEVQLEVVGQLGGQSRAIAVTADTVYLGIGPRIAGLGNALPLLPDAGFTSPLPGMINDIALDDESKLAYVAAGEAGLLLVDVSTVSAARVVGTAETTYGAQAVDVGDGLAVVAEGRPGGQGSVSIVDVSLPEMPWLRAQRKLPGEGLGVALSDAYAYAYVAYEGGLLVLDLSDPDNPAETARLRFPMCGDEVVLSDGYAYVAADGLYIYDLSNPAQPKEVAHFQTTFCVSALAVQEGLAYLSDVFCEMGGCASQLYVVDVSQAAQPRELGTWLSKSAVEDLSVYDVTVYLASRQNGVEAVDVRAPEDIRLLGAYGTLGEVYDVAVSGRFAYVTDGAESGLRVLDLAAPSSGHTWPAVRGRAEVRWADGYAVRDGFAYVPAWQEGLYVLDVRDPDAPRVLEDVRERIGADLGVLEQVVLVEDRAYVVASYYGLVILDIAAPGAPRILGALPLDGMDGGVAVRGEYALVTLDDGEQRALAAIDVRDPKALREVGRASLDGHGYRVAVHGDQAYVSVLDWRSRVVRGGLQVVDVSHPEQPQSVGFLNLPNGAFDVTVSGDYAFIAGDAAGVYVADLANPGSLRLVGLVDTPGSARRVFVLDDQVYVADGAGGLLILERVQ
jgi:photosystem II stability/assembly factor-like uncharacterized protein